MKIVDDSYPVNNTAHHIHERGRGTEIYSGAVATAHGWVYAATYPEGPGRGSTSLSIIINGVSYWRDIDRSYTERGLVLVAMRFAREVTEGA